MCEPAPSYPRPALTMQRCEVAPTRWRWRVEHHGQVLAVSDSHPTAAACALAMATDGVRVLADVELALADLGDL